MKMETKKISEYAIPDVILQLEGDDQGTALAVVEEMLQSETIAPASYILKKILLMKKIEEHELNFIHGFPDSNHYRRALFEKYQNLCCETRMNSANRNRYCKDNGFEKDASACPIGFDIPVKCNLDADFVSINKEID